MKVITDSATAQLAAVARLSEISSSLAQVWGRPTEIGETLRLIVEGIAGVVPGTTAVLYSYDGDNQMLTEIAGVGKSAHPQGENGGRIPSRMGGDEAEAAFLRPFALRAIVQRRQVLSYEDTDLSLPDGLSVCCLPLVSGHEAAGVLQVCVPARRFTQLELLFLSNVAHLAAIAMSHSSQVSTVQRDLVRKEDELQRLRRAGLLISSRTRLEETLVVILQMALEVTGAKYGIFRLVDKEGENLITRAIAGDRLGHPAVEALPINATSITGLVAKLRQPLCIADVRANPWSRIYYPLDYSLEMRSELAVPLIGASGRLEGVLNLESPVVGAFSEDDSHLLQALATQAVIAIQEVRLLDALQEMAERLLTQSLPQVLEHLVHLACDLLNATASAIWTLKGEQLVLAAASTVEMRAQSLPLHSSLTGQAILRRGPIISDDVRSDPRFAWPDLAQAQGWKRALIVPLLASTGEPVGTFSIYSSEADTGQASASDWEKKVLTILAHYAALAVRRAADQAALRAVEEQRVAAETFAAVGDVAANLLHQINNKIGTIPVRVEGIQDKSSAAVASDPYLAANLAEIGRSAREAMDAMRESLSQLQTVQLGPVYISSSVTDALQRVRIPPAVSVQTSGLDHLPPVIASQHSLTLIFTNLLENAIDAMGGNGRVEISGQAGREWVEVQVCDSGPGIPPNLHERIFELSYSGRRSPRTGKLGFGLWWVKTWMTRLGGSVTVDSDGASGTCFTLRLPYAEVSP